MCVRACSFLFLLVCVLVCLSEYVCVRVSILGLVCVCVSVRLF
jgi:hypothetical protein